VSQRDGCCGAALAPAGPQKTSKRWCLHSQEQNCQQRRVKEPGRGKPRRPQYGVLVDPASSYDARNERRGAGAKTPRYSCRHSRAGDVFEFSPDCPEADRRSNACYLLTLGTRSQRFYLEGHVCFLAGTFFYFLNCRVASYVASRRTWPALERS